MCTHTLPHVRSIELEENVAPTTNAGSESDKQCRSTLIKVFKLDAGSGELIVAF